MLKAVTKQLRMLLGQGFREIGQSLDRVGSEATHDVAYLERYSRHRKLMPLDELWPSHGKSFIAPNASITGEVLVGNNCAIWYGAVLLGDHGAIRLDDNVYIGENSTLTTFKLLPKGVPISITIANDVVIEENCSLVSCVIDKKVKVGKGSYIQQGAKIETFSILLPGSVVSPGFTVPAFTVFGGSPAKFVRETTMQDINEIEDSLKAHEQHAQRNQELLTSLGH